MHDRYHERMRQLTLRVDEQLAEQLKSAAAARAESVNTYARAVLAAAVDPELAGDEAARLRERLRAAGLLSEAFGSAVSPPPEELEAARAAAGTGTALSDFVREGRR